jgi:hypothetical protein
MVEWSREIGYDVDGLFSLQCTAEAPNDDIVLCITPESPNQLICRYDNQGEQLWNITCRGNEDERVKFSDVVFDSSGNGYFAGYIFSESEKTKVILVKYDAEGDELWRKIYEHPEGYNCRGEKILINESEQQICICGEGQVNADDFVFALKCELNGNLEWFYDSGLGERKESFSDAVMPGCGDVYIAATCNCPYETTNLLTIKLESGGTKVWERVENIESIYEKSLCDYSSFLLKTDDCVVNVGYSEMTTYIQGGSPDEANIVAVKYQYDGQKVWLSTYGTRDKRQRPYSSMGYGDMIFIAGASDSNGLLICLNENGDVIAENTLKKFSNSANITGIIKESKFIYALMPELGNITSSSVTSFLKLYFAECSFQIPGDINKDCKVDFSDFALLAGNWLDCSREPLWLCNY